jgi:translocator protein
MPRAPGGGARRPYRVAANMVALLAVLVVNGLANVVPIGGRTTGEVSARFPTLVTPAGYAFGIWAAIYLGLVVFVLFQARTSEHHNPRLHAAEPWFVLSCALNVSWLLAWHHLRVTESLVLMLGLLGSLVMVYRRLGTGRVPVARAEHLAVRWPFSLYLGWITVATAANVAIALRAAGWGGWGIPFPIWALGVLAVLGGVGLAVLLDRRDPVFPLVLVWAAVAIAVAQRGVPVVAAGAGAVAGALLAATAMRLRTRRLGQPPAHLRGRRGPPRPPRDRGGA